MLDRGRLVIDDAALDAIGRDFRRLDLGFRGDPPRWDWLADEVGSIRTQLDSKLHM